MTTANPQRSQALELAASRLALGTWLALAIIIAVKTIQNPDNHSIYTVLHRSTSAWWGGVNVYDRNVFADDYRYGPVFSLAFSPFICLPYTVGALLWALLNVGIAYWAIRALAERIFPGGKSPFARDLLLVASIFPSAHCLYSSQTNLLVFAFVAFAAIAVVDGRWWLAAALLAIPIHIKVWPIAAALLMTACWPRRLAWRLPIALVAIAALPLLVGSPAWVTHQYVDWYRYLVGPAQSRHTYRDAWTIWELISAPVNPLYYAMMQLSAAAVALGLCLWQARRAKSTQDALLFILASWTTWQLVFGPGTERNTFALIAPLAGWALATAFLERRGRWMMSISYLLMVLAAIGGFEDIFKSFSIVKAMHPAGVLVFFAWFLIRLVRLPKGP